MNNTLKKQLKLLQKALNAYLVFHTLELLGTATHPLHPLLGIAIEDKR